ncbi:MAG: SOS response-associated peptidase family protein [Burkholderiaceae bacterium]|nr:SOS response-associated peptidase family protein [Burkholderiaceae bacterium]
MCIVYSPSPLESLIRHFNTAPAFGNEWPDDVYQDYSAPILCAGRDGPREARMASYGMVPKRHIPPDVKRFTTMNARAESIGQLRSYAPSWQAGRLCLVPMRCYYEPNWETGSHVRWRIGMADGSDFAVAGLWREWSEQDGALSCAFTQITINADQHELMRRFHRPEDEKRSLVIVPPEEYDAWLSCKDPELARSFLRSYPAVLMAAEPAPAQPKTSTRSPASDARPAAEQSAQASLF